MQAYCHKMGLCLVSNLLVAPTFTWCWSPFPQMNAGRNTDTKQIQVQEHDTQTFCSMERFWKIRFINHTMLTIISELIQQWLTFDRYQISLPWSQPNARGYRFRAAMYFKHETFSNLFLDSLCSLCKYNSLVPGKWTKHCPKYFVG